ncbi:sensor histidine kinase [Alkalihalobacillus sp. MEB130]|uniref:cache domain-containing sensor histidine kinase n=1 Tax=Alkalihalobacillus sp. MEB130 TaxID=2976704 RepID=UPI0028DD8E20|nr:sensor histidine kinase [Alkalihalobacillus sp. MEB130]MDT8860171.1 sensor histidine kinase [Alkalihalobacillus sp. MEB130]
MKQFVPKVLNLIRIRKIKNRVLAALIVLSVFPILLLGLISFNLANKALVDNHIESNQSHLKTTSEISDIIFRNIINTQRLILSNRALRQELIESGQSSNSNNIIGWQTYNQLQNILSSYLVDQRYIDSVCVLDNSFRSVCYGRSNNIELYQTNPTLITDTAWYQRSVEAKGREVFINHNVVKENNDTFSSVKLLLNPAEFSREPIGLLVFNIKKSMFSNMMDGRDSEGMIILDSSENEIRTVYDSRPDSAPIEGGNDLFTTFKELEDDGYILSHYTNQTTGWTYVSAIKNEDLFKDSIQIRTATFSIAALITLFVLVLSYFLSSKITSPIQQIKRMMIDWSKGSGKQTSANKDEFELIGGTFKEITTENRSLNEQLIRSQLKGKEAELRVLQAQINPHFLYNTLDSIYWMAMIEKNDQIASMAIALSESFKISLNHGKETIPLHRELEHIKHYLTIQNIRFSNRFHYMQDVDAELMDKEIMKLLLQPLIENAITHGLERKIGNGTVKLTGRLESGTMIFTVEDDGVGIEDLAVTEKGYGLQNIRERLSLYYGPTSLFAITSEVNKGTVVEIRLPNREGGS